MSNITQGAYAPTTRYPRFLRQRVEDDLDQYPVVAIMGARQVGKSTLCREIADDRGFIYLTLDDIDVRRRAIDDPDGLLAEAADRGIVIDEVQRAPALLLAVKSVVDREQRAGRYLLSGSNQPHVGNAVGDSLLGRAAFRTLRPLTLGELRYEEEHLGWSFLFGEDEREVLAELERRSEASGTLDWRTTVLSGGFPRAVAAPIDDGLQILDDYVTAFVRRDIREIIGIESVDRFETFFRYVAENIGREHSASRLSGQIGTSVDTIRRWTDALARSYMIDLLPPYLRSSRQRVIKAQKLYFVDAAFAYAAAREFEPTGFHLENLIVSDALVWRDAGHGRACYHWRLQGGQEVDLVLEERRRLVPVEIKATSSVNSNDARHLRSFRDAHPETVRGLLLSNAPQIKPLGAGIIAAPWWAVV